MIPEFRELIDTTQQYLRGETHFSYVCAKSESFLFYAKQTRDPRIREIAEAWCHKALQVWDEWGSLDEQERITEREYREWVAGQLAVINDEFIMPDDRYGK